MSPTALINETMDTADHREYQKLLVSPSAMAISLFHRLGFLMLEELGPEGILLFRPRPRADAGSATLIERTRQAELTIALPRDSGSAALNWGASA